MSIKRFFQAAVPGGYIEEKTELERIGAVLVIRSGVVGSPYSQEAEVLPACERGGGISGAAHVNRTRDPFITNEVLYQLS